jgi:cysteine desulfurase
MMTHDEAEPGEIYCDYNATAPLRASARTQMLAWLGDQTGNPSSIHAAGRRAAAAVANAREQVARLIGAAHGEIVFTSGATESNNLALHAALAGRPDATLITTAVEHPAVLEFAWARPRTAPLVVVGVDHRGHLRTERLAAALRTAPGAVVSVMAANNETGVLNDLAGIRAHTRECGALLHTDATQLVGRLPIDVTVLGIDMVSLSAHKFGGPQGTGALYIRRGLPLAVAPLQRGGNQERGWRSGTLNVAGIVGFGAAAEDAAVHLTTEITRVRAIRDEFEQRLTGTIAGVFVNGDTEARLPGVSSVTFPGLPAQAMLAAMPEVAASDGSACASGSPRPSHVLTAMGFAPGDADSVIRFSFGHASTAGDARRAAEKTLDAVRRVRRAMGGTTPVNETGHLRHTAVPLTTGRTS